MAANEPAMSPSDLPPEQALDRITGPRRSEADVLLAMHRELSGQEAVVWAGRILGFGEVEYRYDSGHGGRMPELAFATGQRMHTLYLVNDFADRWPELLSRLGPHRSSKACLYLTRLTGVDLEVLRELVQRSLDETR